MRAPGHSLSRPWHLTAPHHLQDLQKGVQGLHFTSLLQKWPMLSSAESWVEQEVLVDVQKKVAKQEDSEENNLLWQNIPGPFFQRSPEEKIQKQCCTQPMY